MKLTRRFIECHILSKSSGFIPEGLKNLKLKSRRLSDNINKNVAYYKKKK